MNLSKKIVKPTLGLKHGFEQAIGRNNNASFLPCSCCLENNSFINFGRFNETSMGGCYC